MVHKALDMLYDLVDELFEAGKIEQCNNLFDVEPQEWGIQLATGLLTVTFRHKEQLVKRSIFFDRVKQWLQKIEPDRVEQLLTGLE